MDSIITIKKSVNLKHITTRTAGTYGTGTDAHVDIFQLDSTKYQVTTSSCGSQPGRKSCWNVVNQSYTCIPQSNICCGDGHSCSSNLRCAGIGDLADCISVEDSYNSCLPTP